MRRSFVGRRPVVMSNRAKALVGGPAATRRSEREAGSLRALRRSATDAPNNGSQSKLGDTDFGDH